MKKYIFKLLTFGLVTIFLYSCNPSITNPIGTGSLGTLASSPSAMTYVALGNSITAGYMDGAVYPDGQKYSFPKMFAQQIGLTNFVQADIADPGIGARIKFKGFTPTGSPITERTLSQSAVNNVTYAKPFNNLGVPAAVLFDMLDTSDYMGRSQKLQNPFYASILRTGALGKSMIDQAVNLQPTLLTVEMGANDVLGYATSGGTISTTSINGSAVPTPKEAMDQLYKGALMKLTKSLPNTKIIMFTVPEVTGTPFFKTVPWNALVLTSQTQVDGLNAAYSKLGITFHLGQNGFIAESPNSPAKMRQLTAEDDVLLTVPQDSLAMGMGSMKPIPKKYVLLKEEIAIVKQAVTDYNTIINGLTAISPNIKVFDLNDVFLKILAMGYMVPGSTTMSSKFISGELFSMDGIHPTARGYAAVTNELIKFINMNYGADIPLVEIQNMPATRIY